MTIKECEKAMQNKSIVFYFKKGERRGKAVYIKGFTEKMVLIEIIPLVTWNPPFPSKNKKTKSTCLFTDIPIGKTVFQTYNKNKLDEPNN